MRALELERVAQPVPARHGQLADERGQAAPAESPVRLEPEPNAGPRPELGAEDAESQVRVREERVEHLAPTATVFGGVGLGRAVQERALAVGESGRRRQVCVQVLEAPGCELVAE